MRVAFTAAPALAALIIASSGPAWGQGAADEVLIETATVKLTRADFEAELQRVPPEMRTAFATDPKRVNKLLENMLIGKTLAANARKAGLDSDPLVQRRIALEADKVLSEVEVRSIEKAAGAEFDARTDQFLLKARERYTLEKDKFRVSEQISVSQILFATKKRAPEAALAMAKEAQAKLAAGADFATLAKEFSEDPTSKRAGGSMGWFVAVNHDPAVTKAVFELKSVGDVSPPVLSPEGYHLFRLDERRPEHMQSFDEVKKQIMADLRQSYIAEQRDMRIAAVMSDPTLKMNQAAINALIVPMPDSSVFKKARQDSKDKKQDDKERKDAKEKRQ